MLKPVVAVVDLSNLKAGHLAERCALAAYVGFLNIVKGGLTIALENLMGSEFAVCACVVPSPYAHIIAPTH